MWGIDMIGMIEPKVSNERRFIFVAIMVVANSHGEELVSKLLWIVVDVCMLGDLACIA